MGDSTALRFIALKTKSESNTTELLHIKTSCICTVNTIWYILYCFASTSNIFFSFCSNIMNYKEFQHLLHNLLMFTSWNMEVTWTCLQYTQNVVRSLTSKCQSCNCGLTVLNLLQRGLKKGLTNLMKGNETTHT